MPRGNKVCHGTKDWFSRTRPFILISQDTYSRIVDFILLEKNQNR